MKQLILGLVLLLPASGDVLISREKDRVAVSIDGKPFTTLFYGGETMKPYLHPLRTADGKIVTRGYPMENLAGETRDHPHHQGLWFTHGDVNGFDFWANPAAGPKKGKVIVDSITKAEGGPRTGVISFQARWIDANGKALLREDRTMTFSGAGPNRLIDFDVTFTALDQPVKFGDTKEGTFAIRLADSLTEKSKGAVLTNAAGAQTMQNVWGKPSPWVDYSGKLDGEAVGIAIFDHPGNPKHPTTWHARDYGLFAANIFGQRDFTNDKTKDGSVTLEPGKSMRFRYRVVIHPGDTNSAKIAELYEAYKKQ